MTSSVHLNLGLVPHRDLKETSLMIKVNLVNILLFFVIHCNKFGMHRIHGEYR